jgi:hypothetical protein
LAPSEQLSTWSLQIAHNCLVGAIRHAEALSVEQAQQPLCAAAGERPGGDPHPLYAYVVLLLTTGLRPEEARALPGITSTWTRARWQSGAPTGLAATRRPPKSRRTLR